MTVQVGAREIATETWSALRREALMDDCVPELAERHVLSRMTFGMALSSLLCKAMDDGPVSAMNMASMLSDAYAEEPDLVLAAATDLEAIVSRDAAVQGPLVPYLFFKGFKALQIYRVSNFYWRRGRINLAEYIRSRISEAFAVDIHPSALIGSGIMFDHATGIVIGAKSFVEDGVTILQDVTIGALPGEEGAGSPHIAGGVLIGAGAKVLGPIDVGYGARIGAGSVVLDRVEPHTTVVGNPARATGKLRTGVLPAESVDHIGG